MTTAIYIEVAQKSETAKTSKRQVSVSGMLKKLGVSRSGYRAFHKHKPSSSQQKKDAIKNYGGVLRNRHNRQSNSSQKHRFTADFTL